jgi:hypothetical protein
MTVQTAEQPAATETWRDHLLTSKQMAQFVALGYLRLDDIVPVELCQEICAEIMDYRGYMAVGTPFADKWQTEAIGRAFRLPRVEGMIHSLVGPDPLYDHHAVHMVGPQQSRGANLHQDSVTDLRPDYFDIQISLFPEDTPPESGGTQFLPGSHFRNVRTGVINYYQHVKGLVYADCPAGTMYVWNTRLWHGARNNRTDNMRYMFKLRLNPTVKQVQLFDTSDLDDPEIGRTLSTPTSFFGNDMRYEQMKRVEQWRFVSGQPDYDIGERFRRRIEYTT